MGKKAQQTPTNSQHSLTLLNNEFKGESDRACVILAAAMLDSALRNLLQTKFTPCPSSDMLFDGANAPLSTFSSRIDMSYRLGLLSARFCRDLHLVRKIRNDFAHNVTGCAFTDSGVRDRVQALSNSAGYMRAHETWKEIYPDEPKGHFQFAVSWMQWHLCTATDETESIKAAEEEWGYQGDWDSLEDSQEAEPKLIDSSDHEPA